MRAPADSLTPATRTPYRVYVALALLWVAWAVSACTLAVRVFIFGAGFGWVGFIGVAIQALLIYFIGKRSNAARILMLILALIITAEGALLLKVLAQSSVSAVPTIIGYLLRVIALVLLFSGESRQWFRKPQAGNGGL
jgi:hypothetical protein